MEVLVQQLRLARTQRCQHASLVQGELPAAGGAGSGQECEGEMEVAKGKSQRLRNVNRLAPVG